MASTNKARKFFVGTFEVTDANGYINFTGFVSVGVAAIKPLVIVNTGLFGGDKQNNSMAFSSIDIRSLANFLMAFEHDSSLKYVKYSGGNAKKNEFYVSCLGQYAEFKMISVGGTKTVKIPMNNMLALGEELKQLIVFTTEKNYETQRVRDKKRNAKVSDNS